MIAFGHYLKQAPLRFTAYAAFEISLCLIVMVLLASAYLSLVPQYTAKALYSETGTKITTFKSEIVSEYAFLGYWPKPRTLEKYQDDFSTLGYRVKFDGNGTINFYFVDEYDQPTREILSYTAAHVPESDLSPIIWLCGYAPPPKGYEIIGTNITSIDRLKLPNSCKY
ncbi:MAG: hypothetical protein KUG78_20310 [Kangiellaceae bacterium]|nr:hypothetical protein [Kangiellaceae bacterium]